MIWVRAGNQGVNGGIGKMGGFIFAGVLLVGAVASSEVAADTVLTNNDGIVYNSLCVGFDCSTNETFNADTIRLKENNLRIHFDDTSTVSGFPKNDWALEANSSASGGEAYFAIRDRTANRAVFLVEAGAPSGALRVDSGGRVGIRNNNPVTELHIKDGDTPTVRLEQTGDSGFAPQTWDVAGNETSFFIRDVTGGSALPFRVFPSAPSNSLIIEGSTGDIGIGTTSPAKKLHVSGSSSSNGNSNTVMALVENTTTTTGSRTMLELRNFGSSLLLFNDTDTGAQWNLNPVGGTKFVISREGTGVQELAVFNDGKVEISEGGGDNLNARFETDGDLALRGVVTSLSDKNAKRDIAVVDGLSVLARLRNLPVSTWRYKHSPEAALHLGPMAQDFYQAFGLGENDLQLAPSDVAGVALAAVKETERLRREDAAQIAAMRAQTAAMAAQIEALEKRLAETK